MAKQKKKSSQKIDVSKDVMSQIKKGEVTMKPRIYFVAGAALLGLGTGMLVMLATVVLSMISFRIRYEGSLEFLRFGRAGLPPFLHTFPWVYILILVVAIFGGWKLIRKYEFSYKHNAWGILIGFLVLVLTIGMMVDRVGTHRRLMQNRHLDPLYRQDFAGSNWLVGEIAESDERMMKVLTPDEKLVLVDLRKAKIPPHKNLAEGDHVRVVGKWKGDVFEAEGVRGGGPRHMMKPNHPNPSNNPAPTWR